MEDHLHSRFVAEYLIRNIAYSVLDYYIKLKKHRDAVYSLRSSVASVSVRFQSKEKVCENRPSKRGGRGRERKETSPLPPPVSFFGSCSIFCTVKSENPVSRSFCFVLKPHGDACYAGSLGAVLI